MVRRVTLLSFAAEANPGVEWICLGVTPRFLMAKLKGKLCPPTAVTTKPQGQCDRQSVPLFAAALGVFGTGAAWPDLVVAGLMAALALHGGWSVMRQARVEAASSDQHNHAGHVH